jgi:hypothetical protein
MSQKTTFSSPAIARELKRVYGDQARTVRVEEKPQRDIHKLMRQIDIAHKKTAESKLIFK